MQNKPVISYGARSAPSARRLRNDTNPLAVRGQYNVYFRPPDSFHGTTLTAMVGAPSSTASRPALSEPLGGLSKRLLDLAIAVPLLIVLLPVMIVIAILISVFSGGTPIFSHLRVGHGGQLFPCYKFRTMVPDAEVRLNQYIASNPAAAREWLNAASCATTRA